MPEQRVQVAIKPVTTSKTLWLSVVTIVLGIGTYFGLTTSDQWSPERMEGVVGSVLIFVGAINAAIRIWFTTSPVVMNGSLPAMPDKELK